MNNMCIAALQKIPGVGNVRIKTLLSYFGSALDVWKADKHDLLLSQCLEEKHCDQLLNLRKQIDLPGLKTQWDKKKICTCNWDEPEYPALLRDTFNPPVLLYYKGNLPANSNNIAIVGSRKASAYGKNTAAMFAAELSAAGICIVSGAARGIDTAAHQGALKEGRTIAVLGSGVDIVYPPENSRLLSAIAEQGAIISEYPPGTPPHSGHFPARNRIISGLSRGVVVVEAAERSGSLITADFALEEGRDVFAVPGSIFSSGSKGTHHLIQQGAKLVTEAKDIMEEYSFSSRINVHNPILTDEETILFNCLAYDVPRDVETLVLRSSLPLPTVTYLLLQMELRGLVIEHSGQRYVRSAMEGAL
ncbi:MAG: DNA-processing protein DprA [Negativicutes bacterium]